MQYLSARPQYAYTPGKAIDEAIAQVMQHCTRVRERLRSTTRSVHDRRAKKAGLCWESTLVVRSMRFLGTGIATSGRTC